MASRAKRFPIPLIHLTILITLGSALLFYNLGSRPLGGSEGRWGEVAKEMLATRDWIVPRINAVPYRDKPVGSYWLIVLASLPGRRVTEWSTRLPSAAATLFSILLLYFIARAFWGPKPAFLSALVFMTTFPLLRWSRTANADALTLGGTLACITLFAKNRDDPERGTWLYPFFIIAGVTSLMKGLLGFVLPSLGVFLYLLARNRRIFLNKRFLRHLVSAFTAGLVLFLIPFLLDYGTTHSEMSFYLLFKENIVRFFHPFDHTAPFFYYFYYIFITLSPWILFLPFLAWTLWKNGIRRDEGTFFFFLWFAALFTFFTLSGSKRGYYILPVIAPFSALLGAAISRTLSSSTHSRAESLLWLLPGLVSTAGGIVLMGLLLFFPRLFTPHIPRETYPYLYLVALCFFLAGVSLATTWKQRFSSSFAIIFSGFFLMQSIFFAVIVPTTKKRTSFKTFCQKVNILTKGKKLGVFRSADRSVLYYYLEDSPPFPCLQTPLSAREFLTFHRDAYLLVQGEDDLRSLKLHRFKIVLKETRKDSKGFFLVTLPNRRNRSRRNPQMPLRCANLDIP